MLEFTDKGFGPYGDFGDMYYKLNGIAAPCAKMVEYPKKFYGCFGFVGGFTDSDFFKKDKIESLLEEDKIEFLQLITKSNELWNIKYNSRGD